MSPEFLPEPTADGSFTFFSAEFGESFHSRQGAQTEAHQTYVTATHLLTKAPYPEIHILDVCYGLGYNTAAALEAIWAINPTCHIHVMGLEINPDVPKTAIAHQLLTCWSAPVQIALQTLATDYQVLSPHLTASLRIGDARQQIQTAVAAGFQADAIFFDPFSPPRCPQLWTVEFLSQVAQCLKPDGYLATYSCAAAVRTALRLAGLQIGASQAAGRVWPGTVASGSKAISPLTPLSQREQEHLQTKAAVPYRDPTLNASAQAIQAQRQAEQQQSALEPTSRWRKRWLNPV